MKGKDPSQMNQLEFTLESGWNNGMVEKCLKTDTTL
jgi:hypothetical protein